MNESNEQFYKRRDNFYSKSIDKFWCKCSFCTAKPKPINHKVGKQKQEELENKLEDLTWDFYDISDELLQIMVAKHSDYGPNNILRSPGSPVYGLSVRLHDKIERLNNLVSKNQDPKNESIRDTFVDIANYAIIGLLVLDGNWK